MTMVLDVIMGVCWSVAYIAAVIVALKRRTWCFPALAICQNFSWELLAVINEISAKRDFSVAFAIQITWLLLDVLILVIWLTFDKRNEGQLRKNIVILICVFVIMYILAYRGEFWGETSFVINAIMSAAFIWRIKVDKSSWTSYCVAINKLVGSLAATIGYGLIEKNILLLWIGGICLILDSYYLLILHQKDLLGG